MAIETRFLMGDGDLGSKLQVTITPPDLETFDDGLMLAIGSMYPIMVGKWVEGIEGLYVFPLHSGQDWEIVPETGDVKCITLTGFRVE